MSLIAELNRLQAERGYLREEDLRDAAERLRVPLYRIQEVVSFYPHFRTTPPPRVEVTLCRDVSCFLAGGEAWGAKVKALLNGQKDVEVKEVSCLGRCDRAPAAMVNGVAVGAVVPDCMAELARHPEKHHDAPGARRQWRIDPYGEGGEPFSVYQAWAQRADEVIATLKAAGLRGMGGAGFQTGLKGELVRKESP